MLIFLFTVVGVSLLVALILFISMNRKDTGTDLMKEAALAIQEGAFSFLRYEYRTILLSVILIAVVLSVVISIGTGLAFLLGATLSGLSGYIGMKITTITNVRTANIARETGDQEKTLKGAFQGGSIIGLSIGAFGLLGLGILLSVFRITVGSCCTETIELRTNWIGITFIPFAMSAAGYALGCSIIALFNRIGGGIFAKAADIGADLVGKIEIGLPEDDPRNPAIIADSVGDNVGDVAGLGSDIMESFVAALISSLVLFSYLSFSFTHSEKIVPPDVVYNLFAYPILFATLGLVGSLIGMTYFFLGRMRRSLYRELFLTINTAASVSIIGSFILCLVLFHNSDLSVFDVKAGILSPWICSTVGILGGMGIGRFSERYTSYEYEPTQRAAEASREGAVPAVLQGLSTGMKSVFAPALTLVVVVIFTYWVGGVYGIALAAIGMISFVASTIAVDMLGPIIDNAGGICELANLSDDVRGITDQLDSIGNTTEAVAKGYAIGSAALSAISLFAAFLYSQVNDSICVITELMLNIAQPLALAGVIVGASVPYLFSGILLEAVANAARLMITEVRRQLKIDPTILRGETKPDYRQCIDISSLGAIRKMKAPALLGIGVPIVGGFLFGPDFIGGMIVGATVSGVMLAFFTANAGGSWNSGKNFIEKGRYGGKGSPAHRSSVIGDTIGDALKDTVAPALDILIKVLAVVSLLIVSIIKHYNILGFII